MKTKRYWVANNGNISCEEHGGQYLKSAVYQSPKARRHTTPLAVWERMTAQDIEEVRSFRPHVCEGCEYLARQNKSVA